jgi:hypothetical protein
MFNPWFSLSLDAAQLVFKLTRVMAGGTLYPTGSSHISEAESAPVTEVQVPVTEAQEGPTVLAIANDRCRKSTTERHLRKKTDQAKGRQVPKPPKRTTPKRTTLKRTTLKRAAANLARAKPIRRSVVKGK